MAYKPKKRKPTHLYRIISGKDLFWFRARTIREATKHARLVLRSGARCVEIERKSGSWDSHGPWRPVMQVCKRKRK